MAPEMIEAKLKDFILRLDLEEKVLARHIDGLWKNIARIPDANLIATAMAFF